MDTSDEGNNGHTSDEENNGPTTSQHVDVHGGDFSRAVVGNPVKHVAKDSYEGTIRKIDVNSADVSGATFGNKTVSTTNVYNTYHEGAANPYYTAANDAFSLKPEIVVYENDPINAESRILRAVLHSDVTGNQDIAIKILPFNENSKKESSVHFSLPYHPNIVHPIFSNTFKYHGQLCIYIALELCDPLNLYNFVTKLKSEQCPFHENLFISYVQQITEGVTFLHRHRIINRDLKPQNILLNTEKTVTKICDFGLSKPIKGDVTVQSKALAGTSGWMSPEVLRGDEHISTSADLFSLGLIDYFLLSYGEHAFGQNPISRDHFILNNQNLSLENIQLLSHDPLRDVINQMLNPNPILRPTAEQVKSEIEEFFAYRVLPSKQRINSSQLEMDGHIEAPTFIDNSQEVKQHEFKPKQTVVSNDAATTKLMSVKKGPKAGTTAESDFESKPKQTVVSNDAAGYRSPRWTYWESTPKQTVVSNDAAGYRSPRWTYLESKPKQTVVSNDAAGYRSPRWTYLGTAKLSPVYKKLSKEISQEYISPFITDRVAETAAALLQQMKIKGELRDGPETWREVEKTIKDSKFVEAIKQISEFPTTQRQKLIMSECYLQLGEMKDAKECISTLEQLTTLQSSRDDVKKLIDEYISTEFFIRSLVLLPCLSKMYDSKSDPNQAVKGIGVCSYKCCWEVIPMMIDRGGRLRSIATDLGLEIMNDMLTRLRSVSGADSELKSECEYQCLNDTAHCYEKLKKYRKVLELRQEMRVRTKQMRIRDIKKQGVW